MNKYNTHTQFLDIWISKIPAHWQAHKMKHLFSERSEKGYPNEPLLVASQNMGVVPKNVYGNKTVEAQKDLHLLKLVRVGDFVISLRSFQGGLEYAYYQGIISPAYTILIPHEPMSGSYFRYLAKSKPFIGLLTLCVTGIREGQNIDYAKLKNHLLPVPPCDEQDQIVRFLDWKVSGINRLISNYRHQIALLDEMKQRRIDEAVIKGMRKSTIVHNDDIRWDIDYPEHWQIQRIREPFTFRKGLSITKANLEETGIAVISYGQVHSKKNSGVALNGDLIRYVNESYLTTNQSCLVEKGDFIFADTSEDVTGCGNCAYIDWDDAIFAGYHSIIAHPDGLINSKYLAYLFNSSTWRYQIRKKVNGVKVYSITQKMLKDTFILIPPIDEQEEIIRYLDEVYAKIDVTIKKMEAKIANLQDLRICLIADTVTGKIDVRGIEIPEYEFVDEDADADNEDDGEEEIEEQEDE